MGLCSCRSGGWDLPLRVCVVRAQYCAAVAHSAADVTHLPIIDEGTCATPSLKTRRSMRDTPNRTSMQVALEVFSSRAGTYRESSPAVAHGTGTATPASSIFKRQTRMARCQTRGGKGCRFPSGSGRARNIQSPILAAPEIRFAEMQLAADAETPESTLQGQSGSIYAVVTALLVSVQEPFSFLIGGQAAQRDPVRNSSPKSPW